LEPPCSLRQPVGIGLAVPGDLRQTRPPSVVHAYPPQRAEVPLGSAVASHPVVQGDQIVGQWVRAPNSAPGTPSSSSVPAAKQESFIAEARGMGPTVDAGSVLPCIVDALAPSSRPQIQASGTCVESNGHRPPFKINKYNGSTSLETYLLQFKQLATYLEWSEKDIFYNICASLEGSAARVLWELPKGATTADLERLLQTRFGTEQQTISYQAKLRARRREANESLQDLYRDISHLLQLAYPGEGGRFISLIGVDTFITAVNEKELEYEVLKLEPKTLEEAANHAMRLDALARSVDSRSYVPIARTGGQGQSRDRNICAVTDDKPETGSNADLLQHIAQLE